MQSAIQLENTTTVQHQLNQKIKALKPSPTLSINERSLELMKAGKKVYRLGFGQSPFPVPTEIVEKLQQHAHEKDYLPVKGLYELRQAVANFNQRTLGLTYTAEDVLVAPGSKMLIFNLQLALDADLLLPAPSWVSYHPQGILTQKKVTWIDTKEADGWRLTPQALATVCEQESNQSKVLILNYPNNPTGTTYNVAQLQALAQVARQYNIIIISDEIYGEIADNHASLAQFYPEGTIISGGLSKWCGAGGWRLGTFTFPKNLRWLLDAMATIGSETYSTASAPIQYAAITAFNGSPTLSAYINASRRIMKTIGNYVHQQLSRHDVTLPLPEGGFYLFPNFENYRTALAKKGIVNSIQLCEALLEATGVALLPSIAFGRPLEEFTARLAYVDFNGVKALDYAMNHQNLGMDFIEQCCPNIIGSMKAVQKWLKEL